MGKLVPRELTPRMQEVIRMVFEHPTWTQKQIGQALNPPLSDQRVSQILRTRRVLEAFPLIARARIKGMVPQAVNKLGELMNQKANLEVSRKVVERVLDTEKVLENAPQSQTNVFLNANPIELKIIIDKAHQESNMAIDAEIVSDPTDAPPQ